MSGQTTKSITIRNGLIMFVFLTAYFLVMRLLGLGHNYWLRSLNILIVFGMIMNTLKVYKKRTGREYYEEFFDLFRVGISTSLVGIGLFSIFLLAYLGVIDPTFMQEIQAYRSETGLITPFMMSVLIFLEGMGSAFICVYLGVQLEKSRSSRRAANSYEH